jgi:preprotein translocase subunit SecA
VDENTGRLMTGRRWSDGLHQAVEAKEEVAIERETQTLATITIQNYFRLYLKLAGMTGTAETEAQRVLRHLQARRAGHPDQQAHHPQGSQRLGLQNPAREVQRRPQRDQGRPRPGPPHPCRHHLRRDQRTAGSRMLKREGIIHSVLNAKFHQQEAEIVARAGQRGSVTIATNMAGRGTDIKLGPGIPDVGGLHVLATERHEARRIDRQLRGRCARQGDPGSSHFFIALEDDLMRLFGSGRIVKIMEKMGLEENQELEHPLLNRSIEQAQKRVEQATTSRSASARSSTTT